MSRKEHEKIREKSDKEMLVIKDPMGKVILDTSKEK